MAVLVTLMLGVSLLGCSQTPTQASASPTTNGLEMLLKAQNIAPTCTKLMGLTAAVDRAATVYEQATPGYRLIGLELRWPTTLVGWGLTGDDRKTVLASDGLQFTYTFLEKRATHERGVVVYTYPQDAPVGADDLQTVDVYNCGPA